MIFLCYHNEVCHLGKGITHNHLRRNGYWDFGGSSTVAGYFRKCVLRKKRCGSNLKQKMANLAYEGLAEEPPFTYCGVDLFGPFNIKKRRSILKRHGVLFTCLYSGAIHLETGNSLDTSSFLDALRRFLGRRGPMQQLHLDCGTNIVGTDNALKKAFDEMDNKKIGEFLRRRNCDLFPFKFNIPCSSHMGGVWERQIRTVRSVLTPLLVQYGSSFDDETFRTLLVEVENIVNSRPLSVDNINDPEYLEPLIPNHLPTMKSKLLLPPPGRFQKPDLYVRQKWRRMQYLANQFRLRWRKEYVQSLHRRNKWLSAKRNLKESDIVLLSGDNLQRNQWPLARIETVLCGSDGLVRKVRLHIGNRNLGNNGKPGASTKCLDTPVYRLVLLLSDDEFNSPTEEQADAS